MIKIQLRYAVFISPLGALGVRTYPSTRPHPTYLSLPARDASIEEYRTRIRNQHD